jgi:chorismate dehydratase
MLEHECDCSAYEFHDGVPSAVNRMLREGTVDISPSSSIEYLRYPDRYDLIENNSISAHGAVGSVFLFSKMPIEKLNGATILVSSQSETSVTLLRIICSKFYGLACEYVASAVPVGQALKSGDAYLLIGDDALFEALKWPKLHIYDLGDLWSRHTGLPFTYALWLVRKECCQGNRDLISRFADDLGRAKKLALENLGKIAAASPYRKTFSEAFLVEYWKGISYDYAGEHKKGFALFQRYAEELLLS